MKKVIFSLLCLVMIPLSGFADDTNNQTNSSGSNTNITGGYTTTNNNTYSGSEAGQSTSTTTNTTSNSTTNQATDTRVSAMSSAPSMSAYSQDLCLVGISGGVSTIGLSLSGGSYMIDENCERIKLSKTLSDLGMKVAAVSILCQDERVFFAMEQSGTPCPFEGKIGKAAADQWKKYDKLRPDYEQYTADLKYIEKKNKKLEKAYEKKMKENAEELSKQQVELDAVAAEKQKLIDEMNELKGVNKKVKEKNITVHADNGPR